MVEYPVLSDAGGGAWLRPDNMVRFAQTAEACGVDAIALTDHPAPPSKWLHAGGHETFDPFVGLGFFAAATERISLMTHLAVVPYRNPLLLAKSMTTVDVLSGGRAIFVLGAGYLRSEFRALGVDFDERNELFDEALEVLHGVWSTDGLDYDGRHFQARGQVMAPGPVQRPHPPLWIGGNAAIVRERVARSAQGWSPLQGGTGLAQTARTAPIETLDDLARLIGDLRDRLEAHGRDRDDIDINAVNPARGRSTHEQINGIAALADLGVTWTYVDLDPANGFEASLEGLRHFSEEVAARVR